jgi:hypothetical protein
MFSFEARKRIQIVIIHNQNPAVVVYLYCSTVSPEICFLFFALHCKHEQHTHPSALHCVTVTLYIVLDNLKAIDVLMELVGITTVWLSQL